MSDDSTTTGSEQSRPGRNEAEALAAKVNFWIEQVIPDQSGTIALLLELRPYLDGCLTSAPAQVPDRDALIRTMADHGFDHGVENPHAWRCREHDRFPGYCTCPEDLADAIFALPTKPDSRIAEAEQIAANWQEAADYHRQRANDAEARIAAVEPAILKCAPLNMELESITGQENRLAAAYVDGVHTALDAARIALGVTAGGAA